MRGKVAHRAKHHAAERITPAYAGKSVERKGENPFDLDHPRLCGEKSQIPLKNSPIPGSPPPMRGKVTVSSSSRVMIGITPAYAGKRLTPEHFSQHTKDHPRLCGEKTFI